MNYYVRLVQGKGLISRLIEFKESEWPSHVELLETDQDDVPTRVLGSRYPSGIQIRGYHDFPVRRDRWYKHAWDMEACATAWAELERLIGRKYDLRDIFGLAMGTDWHQDGRYICSEAVAWAFEKAEYPLFNLTEPVRRIMPAHFLLAQDLRRYGGERCV